MLARQGESVTFLVFHISDETDMCAWFPGILTQKRKASVARLFPRYSFSFPCYMVREGKTGSKDHKNRSTLINSWAQLLRQTYSTYRFEEVFGCGFSLANFQVLVPAELQKWHALIQQKTKLEISNLYPTSTYVMSHILYRIAYALSKTLSRSKIMPDRLVTILPFSRFRLTKDWKPVKQGAWGLMVHLTRSQSIFKGKPNTVYANDRVLLLYRKVSGHQRHKIVFFSYFLEDEVSGHSFHTIPRGI